MDSMTSRPKPVYQVTHRTMLTVSCATQAERRLVFGASMELVNGIVPVRRQFYGEAGLILTTWRT